MRTWLSAPLGHGYRAGISVRPGSFVSRPIPWGLMLSPTGRIALYVCTALMVCSMLFWAAVSEHTMSELWLTMLIVYAIVWWVMKQMLLGLFPRRCEEEEGK